MVFEMVQSGAIDCEKKKKRKKKKTMEVKGWHEFPVADKVQRVNWLHAMKRVSLYHTHHTNIFIFAVYTSWTIASSEI